MFVEDFLRIFFVCLIIILAIGFLQTFFNEYLKINQEGPTNRKLYIPSLYKKKPVFILYTNNDFYIKRSELENILETSAEDLNNLIPIDKKVFIHQNTNAPSYLSEYNDNFYIKVSQIQDIINEISPKLENFDKEYFKNWCQFNLALDISKFLANA